MQFKYINSDSFKSFSLFSSSNIQSIVSKRPDESSTVSKVFFKSYYLSSQVYVIWSYGSGSCLCLATNKYLNSFCSSNVSILGKSSSPWGPNKVIKYHGRPHRNIPSNALLDALRWICLKQHLDLFAGLCLATNWECSGNEAA